MAVNSEEKCHGSCENIAKLSVTLTKIIEQEYEEFQACNENSAR